MAALPIPPLPHSRSGWYTGCNCKDCAAARAKAAKRISKDLRKGKS